jgi:hypothetical protein
VTLSASIYEYYATKGASLVADEELEIGGPGRAVVPYGAYRGTGRDHAVELSVLPGRASLLRTSCWARRSCSNTSATFLSRCCGSRS